MQLECTARKTTSKNSKKQLLDPSIINFADASGQKNQSPANIQTSY